MNSGYSNNIAIPNINGLVDINASTVEANTITLNGVDISTELTQVPINASNIASLQQATTGITYTTSGNLTTIANNVTITGTLVTTPVLASQTYVATQIANLVASAPTTLDTLNELAVALGNDPNFAATTATLIGTKASLTASQTISGVNLLNNVGNVFYGNGANLTNIVTNVPVNTMKTDTAQTVTGSNVFTNTSNSFTGTHIGSGASLTGITATSLPSNVMYSDKTQITTGQNTFSNTANSYYGSGANLTGVVTSIPSTVMYNNTTQTITGANTFSNVANVFYGSGANLTGITSTALPSTLLYNNTTQTITGANTFSNVANSFTGTFTGSGSGLTLTNLPTNTSPVGTIVMFASNTIPTGWILCDGSLVSSTTFSALFAIIGYTYTLGTTPTTGNFYLPNFIGLFTRGAGSNTYVATSSATTLGQVQAHQVNQHSHTLVSVNTDTQGTTTSTLVVDNVGGALGLSSTHTSVSNPVVTTTATNGTGRTDYNTYTPGGVIQSNENRPNNISMNYIIKWGGSDAYVVSAGTTPTFTQAGATLNLTNNSATSGITSIVLKNSAGTTVTPFTCSSTAAIISVPLTVSTLNLSTITLISPPLMSYTVPPALTAFQIGYTTTFTTASIIPVTGAFLNIGAIWMPNGVWMVTTNNVLVTSAIATVSRIVFETSTIYTTFSNNNSIQQWCNTVVIPAGSAQAYNSTVVLTMAANDRFWANMSCNFTPAGSLTCQATIQATRIA